MLWTWREVGVSRGGSLASERCVQSQFMTESLLFAAVGEPVVHADLSDQVGPQASELGGRDAPLDTLSPEETKAGQPIGHCCDFVRSPTDTPHGGFSRCTRLLMQHIVFLDYENICQVCPVCLLLEFFNWAKLTEKVRLHMKSCFT